MNGIEQVEASFHASLDHKSSRADQGMVSTAFPEATRAGIEMLERGGNAVDAACAASLALCVCEPQASGIGGQTMAMVSKDGDTTYLNGSGRIPQSLDTDRLSPMDLRAGYRATTVPTTLATLDYMNRRYGRLPWETLFAPAISIAKNGYCITALQHGLQKKNLEIFLNTAPGSGARYFLKNQTQPYAPGDRFKQSDLALVLDCIARKGVQEFYTGGIAHAIAEDMANNGGFLNLKDLSQIPWPTSKPPLSLSHKGFEILVPPPPAPGRGLLRMLRVMDRLDRSGRALPKPGERVMADIIRSTLSTLAALPADPAAYRYDRDPALAEVNIRATADTILGLADPEPLNEVPRPVGGETTHLSVMDREGTSVSLTQSVNLVYGAKAAAKGMGFLYNNYLVDCNLDTPDHPHFLKPCGLSVSMVCPTIVFRAGKPWIVTGSPGSDRILSAVFQFLFHVIHSGMSIDAAVKMPRLHCPPSGVLMMEKERFPKESIQALKDLGYPIEWYDPWSFYHGAIHTTLMCQAQKGFQGVAEYRRDGIALGLD